MPLLLLLSVVALECSSNPPTYKPTGGVLNATAFEAFLVNNAASADELVLAPGIYHITNLTSGAHLLLTQPLSNVLVDMTGVTLVMDQRSNTAVMVSNWKNVTLQGLTIEYAVLPTNQAIIKAISDDGKSIDVDVPLGWPLEDWKSKKTFSCNVYVPGTRFLRVGSGDMRAKSIAPSATSKRSYIMTFGKDQGPNTQSISVGDVLGCRNAAFAFTFHVDGCSASTFRDITLKGGPGFGFFHSHPKGPRNQAYMNTGGNTFDRLWLTYPDPPAGSTVVGNNTIILSGVSGVNDGSSSSSGALGKRETMVGPGLPLTWPVLSASADAFHIVGLPNGPRVLSSVLEGHNDDGIAIHGSYSLVVDYATGNTSTIPAASSPTAGAFQLWVTSADYGENDLLKLYAPNFLLASTLRVVSVADPMPHGRYNPPHNTSHTMPNKKLLPEPHAWYQLLTVTTDDGSPPPADVGFDYVIFNTHRSCSGFNIVNNTIRNHRARGLLVKASNGLIHGNHIENSTLGGMVITPELNWGEGDYASNLNVTNNTVRSVCTGKQCYGGIALGAKDPSNSFAGGPPYGHSSIRIVGNRLEAISQMSLWVSSVDGVEIVGNTIVSPYASPSVATCCPPYPYPQGLVAWMTETNGANVSDNCVIYPPSGVRVFFNTTNTVVNSVIKAGGFRECNP
jgi:hypothetical protein